MPDDERELPQIDTSVPHVARVYDYRLGGTDHFEADREAVRAYPDMHSSVRANRAFLRRAVQYLAGEAGIRQFLDIGTGLLPQRVNPRTQKQVAQFFDGLELVEPGVVPIQQWRPGSDEEAGARAALRGGAGRKP